MNGSRLKEAKEELTYIITLLDSVDKGEMSLVQMSKKLDITPQKLNQELNSRFRSYNKKAFSALTKENMLDLRDCLVSSSDKLLKMICGISSTSRVYYPEYNEELLWSKCKLYLNKIQYCILSDIYGNGVQLSDKELMCQYDISEEKLQKLKKEMKSSLTKHKKEILNDVFNLGFEEAEANIKEAIKDKKEHYTQLVREYNKLINAGTNTEDIEKIDKLCEEHMGKSLKEINRETVLFKPIQYLQLPSRIENALRRNGYETVYSLVNANKKDIEAIRNIGYCSVKKIEEYLRRVGFIVHW